MLPTEEHHSRAHQQRKKALKFNLHLSTRKALLLSVIVIGGGIWFSLEQSDWSWFSRSGSLIVIIGVLLTSSQIIENSRKLKTRRSQHDHNFNRDFANDIKEQTLKRSRSLDEDIWENSLRGLYLLVAGTLIWGFGDLAGLIVN
jgi:hypothetical protein